MDSLAQTLEQLIPQSLDDVIRRNRDKARLYLSTNVELDALRGRVASEVPKAHMSGAFLAEPELLAAYRAAVRRKMPKETQ